jgi:GNAT superfamily N-acetyltransferase
VRSLRTAEHWALATILPVHVSDYDQRTYPTANYIVLLDGSSSVAMMDLVAAVPRGEVILKTSSEHVASRAVADLGGRIMRRYISYTLPSGMPLAMVDSPLQGTALTPELANVFAEAGYARSELEKYFQHGARWFARRQGSQLVSACFVYENFETIWEVAGVFTRPDFRRQGLASSVVTAALRQLSAANLRARYQVSADNAASLSLAMNLGLEEFLRVTHVWMTLEA